jgi:hypothetical protein
MRKQLSKSTGHRLAQLLLLCFALGNAGCLAVAAGAAGAGGAALGYAYLKGRVYENYNASFNDTWMATETALNELAMPVLSRDRQENSGYVETRTADQESVRVYLEAAPGKIPAEPTITRVSVRVATFGDKQVSNRILDQVDAHLVRAGTAAPQLAAQPPAQGVVQTAAPAPAALPPSPSPIVPQQTPPPPLSSSEPPIRK